MSLIDKLAQMLAGQAEKETVPVAEDKNRLTDDEIKKAAKGTSINRLAYEATEKGDVALLERFYQYDPECIYKKPDGNFPYVSSLACALEHEQHECVKFLWSKKPRLESRELYEAVRKLNYDMAEQLLKAGADPNKNTGANCFSALIWALPKDTQNNNLADCVKMLVLLKAYGLDFGAAVNAYPLSELSKRCCHISIPHWNDFVDVILKYIDDKIIIKFFEFGKPYYPGQLDKLEHKSPEFLLAFVKHVKEASLTKYLPELVAHDALEAVTYVIEKEQLKTISLTPEVEVVMEKAIRNAAADGNVDCLKELLKISRAQQALNKALGHAIKFEHGETVDYLLKEGADPDYVFTFDQYYPDSGGDRYHRTTEPLLIFAAKQPEIAASLLKSGADPDAVDGWNMPLLSSFIKRDLKDDNKIIRALLKGRADVEAMDDEGFKPMYWASKTGNVEAMQMLLAVGAKYDDGASLRRAHVNRQKEMVELLEAYEQGKVLTREEAGLGSFWEEKMANALNGRNSGEKGMFV